MNGLWPLHGERLLDGLRTCRYEPAPIVLPAGEGFKTLETVSRLYNGFCGMLGLTVVAP